MGISAIRITKIIITDSYTLYDHIPFSFVQEFIIIASPILISNNLISESVQKANEQRCQILFL